MRCCFLSPVGAEPCWWLLTISEPVLPSHTWLTLTTRGAARIRDLGHRMPVEASGQPATSGTFPSAVAAPFAGLRRTRVRAVVVSSGVARCRLMRVLGPGCRVGFAVAVGSPSASALGTGPLAGPVCVGVNEDGRRSRRPPLPPPRLPLSRRRWSCRASFRRTSGRPPSACAGVSSALASGDRPVKGGAPPVQSVRGDAGNPRNWTR